MISCLTFDLPQTQYATFPDSKVVRALPAISRPYSFPRSVDIKEDFEAKMNAKVAAVDDDDLIKLSK